MSQNDLMYNSVNVEKCKSGIKRCLMNNENSNIIEMSFEKKYHTESSATLMLDYEEELVEDKNNLNDKQYLKDSKKRKGRELIPFLKKEKNNDKNELNKKYVKHNKSNKHKTNLNDIDICDIKDDLNIDKINDMKKDKINDTKKSNKDMYDDTMNDNSNNEEKKKQDDYIDKEKKQSNIDDTIEYYTYLIIQNLSKDANEDDIKSLIRPFIQNKIPEIQSNKYGMIVKLYDNELNQNIYNYFNQHPTQIKGSFVKIKLSDQINDLDHNHQKQNQKQIEKYNIKMDTSKNINKNLDKRNMRNSNTESKVILVSVVNLQFPVNIDLIYFLFSKCGLVEKIITFSKTPIIFQSLVQFHTIEQAKEAIKSLHNRNIYDGCNTILIQFSFLKELIVKANNNTSWDYTITSNIKKKNSKQFQIVNGVLPTPKIKNNTDIIKLIKRKFKINDFETRNIYKTPVLICYNIPKGYTEVNKIFNLFSIYGYVLRIKILRDKPDSALIQYINPLYATLSQECLKHAVIGNNMIELHFSKIHDIRITANKNNDSYKAKVFNVSEQRYTDSNPMKYVKVACRPTKTLFLTNINKDVNEKCIYDIFKKYGSINKIKIHPLHEGTKHLMATIELKSEEMATRALMDLHNYNLNDRLIKISYAKTKLI